MGEDPRDRIIRQLRSQAGWCATLGSSLYEDLLVRAAADAEAGGPTWTVVSHLEGSPSSSAPALRFMGAVHRLVLEGKAPELAAFYPTAGGTPGDDAWPAFAATLEEHRDELVRSLVRPVQTNEVGRAA